MRFPHLQVVESHAFFWIFKDLESPENEFDLEKSLNLFVVQIKERA